MAYDGNGTFVRLHNWTADAANSVDINASEMDGEDNGFAAGLSNAVTRDGQGKMAVDFLPNSDNTLNLGSVSKRWATLNGVPVANLPVTQSAVGLIFQPQTAAELAALVTPTNYWYPAGNVLRYGTNTTPGTTDMSAAIQSAFNQHVFAAQGGAPVYIPAGTYLVTTTIASTGPAPFIMYGDGIGRTVVTKSGDTDLFRITNSGSAYNQITISGMTVTTTTAMSTGNAFALTGTGIIPTVTMRDVMSVTGASTNFASVIRLVNCGECEFTRCFLYGANSAAGFGWNVTASVTTAQVYKFVGCSVYSLQVGASFSTTTNPGLEGIQFYGCDMAGVQYGLSISNSLSPAYFPPQLTWLGGHINATVNNFLLQGITQVVIQSGLFYNSGSAQFISLTNCGDLSIVGNTFVANGGTPDCISSGNSGLINLGLIAGNVFKMGASGVAINLLNANFVQNCIISGNMRSGGSTTVATTGAVNTATTTIQNNTPLDFIDYFDSTLTGAALMTLVGIRSDYVSLAAPGGAITCTKLTSRRAGDKVVLASSSNLITIQHNGTNPDGFILQGGVNYTFPATGGRLTLQQRNGGCWTEVSRDG